MGDYKSKETQNVYKSSDGNSKGEMNELSNTDGSCNPYI